MYIIGRLVWYLADVYTCRLTYGFIFFMKNNNLKKKITHQQYLFQQNTVNFLLKHDLYQKGL